MLLVFLGMVTSTTVSVRISMFTDLLWAEGGRSDDCVPKEHGHYHMALHGDISGIQVPGRSINVIPPVLSFKGHTPDRTNFYSLV